MSNQQQSDDELVNALLPAFIDEANAQCDELESLLLQLETTPDDRGLLDALFRCAHTIKGSGGMFGQAGIVRFTHHVETLLDRLREGHLALTPRLITLLLQSNDVMRELVRLARDAQDESPEAAGAREKLVVQLKQATAGTGEPAEPVVVRPVDAASTASAPVPAIDAGVWQVAVRFGVDAFRHGIDPLTLLNYVRNLGAVSGMCCEARTVPGLDAFDPESCYLSFAFGLCTTATRHEIERAFQFAREDCTLCITEPTRPAETGEAAQKPQRPRSAGPAAGSSDDSSFIRVHADRLDEVINLLGELVIAGAGASMLARNTGQRSLVEANQQVTRLIEGIRNSTLKLRMVPIGETFARFRRVVRDTATDLGKDVALEIIGGETELDKAMVDRVADPLMHLVRNAMDHGLETAEERLASGKPAQGTLTLNACHESGSILIRILDDGRGIQRDKVLRRAWDRRLVEPGVVPPDEAILDLIFAPGFSTAEQVTNLSGRGVGMDVVRSNVQAMRGSVSIQSAPGQGTCIEIRLPLTLAIIDGFLVGVGASKFIFPLDAVVEVIASRATVTTVDARGRCCVELRGQVLPVVDLRTLYALDSPQPERSSVVVVRAGTRRYGVLVDALLGQHQTVIKPLGLMLRSLRGVSGSSILGTGEVALIFDVGSLGQLAATSRVGPGPSPLA
ncbi:chemotaxis protein CheA [uncultured Sphaerotilus sp.]|uniref:chemotaxis protein CheA n=1 Tax=uncultured Sphaerotilus sp. TaxID=474984 RepID=UPI0030CA13A2